MEEKGVLMKKLNERSGVSARTGLSWKQAEFLMEIPGQYHRHINFSVRDGAHDLVARFEQLIGHNVTVSFDIDAHEFEGRWFNDVKAWGILEQPAQ
jgi:hypothetical protein